MKWRVATDAPIPDAAGSGGVVTRAVAHVLRAQLEQKQMQNPLPHDPFGP